METVVDFSSHYAVEQWRVDEFRRGVAEGTSVAFVVPLFLTGWVVLFLHMMVPRHQKLAERFSTFAVVAAFNLWAIAKFRTPSAATGVALGMLASWNIVQAATLLVLKDAKREFRRVVRVPKTTKHASANGHANGHANGSANGHANGHANGNGNINGAVNGNALSSAGPGAYKWQSFPINSFWDRLAWSADLVTSFRGINWNWKISGMPSRSPLVEASLENIPLQEAVEKDSPVSRTGRSRINGRGQVVAHNLKALIIGYLCTDVLKTIINLDPYFWGNLSHPAPAWLGPIFQQSPVITKAYRLAVTFAFIFLTLQNFFALVGLVFSGLLGGLLGVNAEAWVYPAQFGSYSSVLTRGMAGFWGGWWHQIFRYWFQAVGVWVTSDVLRLSRKSPVSGLLQLCFSFYLSGAMHAGISINLIGASKPWSEMFLFFALQPLGVVLGLVWVHLLKVAKVYRKIPNWLGWLCNFVWVHTFLYLTLPLLTNDLIRGGQLLQEPIPYSPLRGLGFGAEGDTFFCWADMPLRWHTDKQWWFSGLTM